MLKQDRVDTIDRLRTSGEAAINSASRCAERGLMNSVRMWLEVADRYANLAQEYRQTINH